MVAGAKTEDQQLRALEAAAQREIALPADAFVVGEPITAAAITYSGHPRAGLTLWGVRGERRVSVALSDVAFPPASAGARFVSLYRAWLGFGELPSDPELTGAMPMARHKVTSEDITVGSPVELVVLACKSNALRCRLLGTAREITLRTAVRDEVPGVIVTVLPTKQWTHARHAYLAGNVLSMRADVEALGLVPLALHDQGEWDPAEHYWGEEDDPIEEWAKPIVAHGRRPMFEMEQVLPGADPEDFDSDPIIDASELNAAGDRAGAREVLMKLLARDLRCLDAHAHLGNFAFDRSPTEARRHYEIGMSIGALSLGGKFDGVLAWGLVDNRPFLRCLNGVGLCWWRSGNTREAAAVFRKMLWLNPSDNQGARFNLAAVEAGKTWDEMEGDS
ncbi:MAG: cytoplasmic protein [Polyangiaceae bacterium]|nr:cytoplasmic protein [Polyangiaceae bacterium]